ncbi:MAG: alpha/beta fold hydrolase [Acetatifactor sp.]|nr:alpha/beta fold hydrolase [Acetatifactor sp.]
MKVQDITIKHHGRNISGKVYLPEKDKYPIVVFSHGFNGAGDDFRIPAESLAKNGIAALTYDFCGGALNSKSDMQTHEMTVFTEKEDLTSVLSTVEAWENIDSNNIFLFGASMGCLVSTLVAEEHAHEIKGMILLFPALCVADNWNERFPSVDAIPQQYDVWGVPLGKSFFETLHGFDIFENIGKYSGNVLIMHGDKDDIVPVEYSERAREIYQNSRLEIFHGEGHGFSVAGNDKVIQMLIEFIISVGSSIC